MTWMETISAVYLSDSDDEKEPYGMIRYMIKNREEACVIDRSGRYRWKWDRIFSGDSKGSDLWEKRVEWETRNTENRIKFEVGK